MYWVAFAGTIAAAALMAASTAHAQPASSIPRWTMTPTPTVRIGTGGTEAEEFDRIIGAIRLAGGEIVVADGASQELRVFSPAGLHLRTMSRRGEGPGEFRNLRSIAAARDTLFALEQPPGPSRLHFFTVPDGFLRHHDLPSSGPGGVTGLARLAGGAMLVMRGGFRAVTPPPVGTLARDSLMFGILRPDGKIFWLGRFPAYTWLGYALPQGAAAVGQSLTRFHFGGSVLHAGGGDRAWIGDTESGRILMLDATGQRLAQLAAPVERRRLSHEAVERSRREALESNNGAAGAARINAIHDRARDVDSAPYYSSFTAGPDGELWIEAFRESELEPTFVIVLDRAGRAIGRLTLPPRATLLNAGEDFVLLLLRDSDGLPSIGHHALQRRSR